MFAWFVAMFLACGSAVNASIVVNASGEDAPGDTFGSGAFDITSLKATVTTTQVTIVLGFNHVVSRDPLDPNFVVGFIDFDVDRSLLSSMQGFYGGIGSNVEFYALQASPGLDFAGVRIGTDVYIDLFSLTPDQADVVNVITNSVVGIASLSLNPAGTQLTVEIEQVQGAVDVFGSLLEPNSFHFGALVGPIPTLGDFLATDVAISLSPGIVQPSPIPEPASVVLWGLLTAVAGCRAGTFGAIANRKTIQSRPSSSIVSAASVAWHCPSRTTK